MHEPEIEIAPDPSPEEREAVLAAVRAVLARESDLGSPPTWRHAGRTDLRTGIRDLGPWVSAERRWALSARLPWGGRVYPGLIGRGDAK